MVRSGENGREQKSTQHKKAHFVEVNAHSIRAVRCCVNTQAGPSFVLKMEGCMAHVTAYLPACRNRLQAHERGPGLCSLGLCCLPRCGLSLTDWAARHPVRG